MFKASQQLRELLNSGNTHQVPGCHDAIGARLIHATGFPAVYVPGYNVAASLGLPDLGLVTMSEMLSRAQSIARSVPCPVIMDGEGGYGTALNVAETVRRYEAAGIAGIHLEDQVTPKLASASKTLIPINELQDKIFAAVKARSEGGLVIIARTDAMATPGGLADALKRAQACEEAGADAILLKFLTSAEEVRTTVKTLRTPLVFAHGETIRPTLPLSTLKKEGCAMVLYTLSLMLSSAATQLTELQAIQSDGDPAARLERMMPFAKLNSILGDEAYLDWERSLANSKG
jgi:2-methylisocitrate lyase-like PEP mutase family enzyme